MTHRHLVNKVEIRFIIGGYYTNGIIQFHKVFKKRIAQWLAGWYTMLMVYDSSPESDTLGMTEEDFIF